MVIEFRTSNAQNPNIRLYLTVLPMPGSANLTFAAALLVGTVRFISNGFDQASAKAVEAVI